LKLADAAACKVAAHLAPEKNAALFEPMAYQGFSPAVIDRPPDGPDRD
jgi:3-carboxy-cis,cis-muconate cycloisomerase